MSIISYFYYFNFGFDSRYGQPEFTMHSECYSAGRPLSARWHPELRPGKARQLQAALRVARPQV